MHCDVVTTDLKISRISTGMIDKVNWRELLLSDLIFGPCTSSDIPSIASIAFTSSHESAACVREADRLHHSMNKNVQARSKPKC
jgi:hypothetical protein